VPVRTLTAAAVALLIATALCAIPTRAADDDAPPAAPKRPAPKVARLDRAKMEEVNGAGQDKDGIRRRPWVPDDHNGELLIENLYIHSIVDHKGIYVTSTSTEKPKVDGLMPTYKTVIIRNCEIGPITLETRGLHIDSIKADGSKEPGVKNTLLIEDVLIHDTNGGVMTVLCKDGAWDRIILRRVETLNVQHPVTIGGNKQFPQGEVLIDECPGLQVALQGEPGTIGTVTVRDSPGANVTNARDGKGDAPWAKIVVEPSPANGAKRPRD